jgi:hypothetical protein
VRSVMGWLFGRSVSDRVVGGSVWLAGAVVALCWLLSAPAALASGSSARLYQTVTTETTTVTTTVTVETGPPTVTVSNTQYVGAAVPMVVVGGLPLATDTVTDRAGSVSTRVGFVAVGAVQQTMSAVVSGSTSVWAAPAVALAGVAPGERGTLDLLVVVCAFGFTALVLLRLVELFVLRGSGVG